MNHPASGIPRATILTPPRIPARTAGVWTFTMRRIIDRVHPAAYPCGDLKRPAFTNTNENPGDLMHLPTLTRAHACPLPHAKRHALTRTLRAALLLALPLLGTAHAQGYPNRPVTILSLIHI